MVYAAIIAANTAHLTNIKDERRRFDGMDELPPDSARRPVSVRGLAASIGMPFETCRRHVNRLIADGYCRRANGGLIVPAEVIASEASSKVLKANLANVRAFLRNLKRLGLEAD